MKAAKEVKDVKLWAIGILLLLLMEGVLVLVAACFLAWHHPYSIDGGFVDSGGLFFCLFLLAFFVILFTPEAFDLDRRIYFRFVFGMYPPWTKRDRHAMFAVQPVVSHRLRYLDEKRSVRKALIRTEDSVLRDSRICFSATDPKGARRTLKNTRAALARWNSDRRRYDRLDRRYDDAKAIAEHFSFSV